MLMNTNYLIYFNKQNVNCNFFFFYNWEIYLSQIKTNESSFKKLKYFSYLRKKSIWNFNQKSNFSSNKIYSKLTLFNYKKYFINKNYFLINYSILINKNNKNLFLKKKKKKSLHSIWFMLFLLYNFYNFFIKHLNMVFINTYWLSLNYNLCYIVGKENKKLKNLKLITTLNSKLI